MKANQLINQLIQRLLKDQNNKKKKSLSKNSKKSPAMIEIDEFFNDANTLFNTNEFDPIQNDTK
jgi:hypothetical protein